ncbi:hypothetical protein ACFVSH_20390, partial [Peribacillus sp. NPDC058002]
KLNDLRLIGAQVRDSCGSCGTGETPQAFTPRRLNARPAESKHLEGKSTTPLYLVNSNKVCENSLSLTGCCSTREIEEQSLDKGLAFDKGKESIITYSSSKINFPY